MIKEEVGKGGSKTGFYFSAVHAPYPRCVVVSGIKFTFEYSCHALRVEEGLGFVASVTDDPHLQMGFKGYLDNSLSRPATDHFTYAFTVLGILIIIGKAACPCGSKRILPP